MRELGMSPGSRYLVRTSARIGRRLASGSLIKARAGERWLREAAHDSPARGDACSIAIA